MAFDWLKSLRARLRSVPRRRFVSRLETPTTLEPRLLLSATPIGGLARANTYTSGNQSNSAVATDAKGNYVIAWQSGGQDGDGFGIYAQRFNATGVPLGAEFRVNSFTTGNQFAPSIGIDAAGDFVITWQSNGQDGDGPGIYAQRYNAVGAVLGSEFRVNTTTTSNQYLPSIGMDAAGDFVITWSSYGQDGSSYGIYAQSYNSSGVPLGSEFRVNSTTLYSQFGSVVALDVDGDFVISWQSFNTDSISYEIYAQRYNSAGVAQGSEFQVNSITTGKQSFPNIAVDAAGEFVICWTSEEVNGGNSRLKFQRFNSDGVAQGAESQVSSYTTNSQRNPSIANDSNGEFVIIWESTAQNGSLEGIYARRYSAGGVSLEPEFRVNTSTIWQASPAIAMVAGGDFISTWTSDGLDGSGFGVFAQRSHPLTSGLETRVNSFTTGSQRDSAVATDANGNYVITWVSNGQDGSLGGIYAQRYNASGVALGSEFRVNSFTTEWQYAPKIAMDFDGDFVIAWSSNGQDGSGAEVYAQRYNAAGVPQGTEFRVNSFTTGGQGIAAIAMDDAGDFVISWVSNGQDGSGYGIYAQRYNSAGVPQGTEFQVNTYTTNFQSMPSIGMDHDGDFVIAWASDGQDGSFGGIYARRYNAAGLALGTEFQVNSFTTAAQWYPSIGMDHDGDFVIAWTSDVADASSLGIFAQRYSSSGVPQGGEFRVNSFTTGNQSISAIGMDADGDFVISWTSFDQDGSTGGVYAQVYNSTGVPLGTELLVNTFTTGFQFSPAVGMDADGDFVISWTSPDQDGSSYGVYAQRFRSFNAGWETRVNATPIHPQWESDVATDANGNYVVTWTSNFQDSNSYGIFAQRYNAAGVALGAEFQVNTYTLTGQRAPAIAMDADGDFVITWHSYGQDGSSYGIYAQRYSSSGVPQGGEFRVNSYTTNYQYAPSIGMDADGDFVITWYSNGQDGNILGIFAQRYNAAGIAQGNEFQVNSTTNGEQFLPKIGMDSDGDFVITWVSYGQDGSGAGIYAQRYNLSGVPQGNEFRVNSFTTGNQTSPSIGLDADGAFVITWMSDEQDGSSAGIFAQRYNAAGVPQGGEFRVNSLTVGSQYIPAIGMDADGDFAITWTSNDHDGSGAGVYVQRYSSSGVPQGTQFQVNLFTTDNQSAPAIGLDDDGDFVVTWTSYKQDGSEDGIYSQRYRVNTNLSGINSAPVLNNAGTPTLDSILQNQSLASNNGTLVSDIIARMGPAGGITDPNGNLLGIAINGVSNSSGSWEYTVNGGTNWTPISVTGNSNALLLAANGNTRLRFLPNANFIGQSILAFVAWDRTSGANGGTANVTQRGGTTPFSLAYETASISVNNAAPVLNNSGTPTLDTIPQNVYGINNTGTLVSDIIARMGPSGGITDANPGALQGIAINGLGNTATGDWQYSINGGATWSLIGTTGNSNARLLAADANTRIRYVPQVGYQGTAIFSFVAWDRTSGGNGAVTSVGTRGGTTPYSLDYDYASIFIVNSAPVLNDAGNPLLDGILPNVPDASNPGTLVSDLIYRMYPAGGITDANPYALRGIAIIGKSGTGTWEFSTNNGTSWSAINSTSAANATLLSSDPNTRVRYRPAVNFVGEAKIAFVAWDQTSGTNGAVANASTRGGTTAFSTTFENASIFVNTASTLNNSGTPTLDSISNTLPESSNFGTFVFTLVNRMGPSGGITDPDPGALKGIAIIGLNGAATGTWQYTTNGGTSWSNITTTGSANALLLAYDTASKIRYVPNAGFTGTVAIAFAAWDRSQWLNGSTVNAGARGGTTPFSLDYETATITITA